MRKAELYDLVRRNKEPPRYLPDVEAEKRGHIVLRLPPYHCQYNPIELIWGIMKQYYDKNIGEYGDFSEEKCLNLWNRAISKITPDIWSKVVKKVDALIEKEWEMECNADYDKTDYSSLVFKLDDDDDSDDSEWEGESEEDVDDPGDFPFPHEDKAATPSKIEPPQQFIKNERKNTKDFKKQLFNDKTKSVPNKNGCDKSDNNDVIDLTSLDNLWVESLQLEDLEDEVQVEAFNYKIRNKDLQTLEGNGHVNDEIINVYLKHLTAGERSHAFGTFFYPRLLNGSHHAVRGQTKNVNIFELEFVIFPIHLPSVGPDGHWALVIADMTQKTIRYLDSLNLNGKSHLDNIEEYLKAEASSKEVILESRWKRPKVKDLPRQSNGHDCGVYLCLFAASIIQKKPLVDTNIQELRKKIKCDILSLSKSPKDVEGTLPDSKKRKSNCNASHSCPQKKRKAQVTQQEASETFKIPKFRKKVECKLFTDVDGVYLSTSSHVHLRCSQFKTVGNNQSATVSVCALATYLWERRDFTDADLDHFIYSGHHQHQLLAKTDTSDLLLPKEIKVSGKSFEMNYSDILEERYDNRQRNCSLAESLSRVSQVSHANDPVGCGFLLMGHGRCVALWPVENGHFFLFNPHCVDKDNKICTNANKGAGRLFSCVSSNAAALVSFKNDVFDDLKWKLLKATIVLK